LHAETSDRDPKVDGACLHWRQKQQNPEKSRGQTAEHQEENTNKHVDIVARFLFIVVRLATWDSDVPFYPSLRREG
jgi:hypothetical protein